MRPRSVDLSGKDMGSRRLVANVRATGLRSGKKLPEDSEHPPLTDPFKAERRCVEPGLAI